MKKTILVAGATGNLGHKICRELIKQNVTVRALVREGSDPEKIKALEQLGVDVFKVNLSNEHELIGACNGVSCVISALAGLHTVIIDAQTKILTRLLPFRIEFVFSFGVSCPLCFAIGRKVFHRSQISQLKF